MDRTLYIATPAHLAVPLPEVLSGLEGVTSGRRLAGAPWCLPVVGADLGLQWAVEAELSREGLDRAALGGPEFAVRAESFAQERAEALVRALEGSTHPPEAVGTGPEAATAGRTAFVALYEAGLVELLDRVLPGCPRCGASLAPGEAERVVVDGEVLVIGLDTDDGSAGLEVRTEAPELLSAVTAVVVPPGHPGAGGRVVIPVEDRTVPVLEDDQVEAVTLLVPGHDAAHWRLGRRLGLPAPVLAEADRWAAAPGEGGAGPEPMGRFALRQVVSEELGARGCVLERRAERLPADRCPHCGTLTLSHLGGHWVLSMGPLNQALEAAVASGELSAEGVPELGRPGSWPEEWVLGRQLGFGPRVPVQWCLDCGKPTVALADAGSCGICMGELREDEAVLDAGFVAAAWAAEQARRGAVYLCPPAVPALPATPGWTVAALALARRAGAGPLAVRAEPAPGSDADARGGAAPEGAR